MVKWFATIMPNAVPSVVGLNDIVLNQGACKYFIITEMS